MSNDSITIAVDAMGGENSSLKVLKGIELFCKNNSGVKIIIFGNKDQIEDEIKTKKIIIDTYEIHNTTENVNDNDNANTILRSRKNSSIFVMGVECLIFEFPVCLCACSKELAVAAFK